MRRFRNRGVTALLLISLMVVLVWCKTGIYFETNDDRCITEILCGRMTGSADAHTVYVSYLLALPLSLLYRLVPTAPWYGMTLILFQVLAYSAVLESIYSRCVKKLEFAAGTALTALVLLMNLYLLGCIQYTSTAALSAAAGYFCILVQADRKRRWRYFCLLELLSGLLRSYAMMMIQPMGILVIGGMLTGRREMSCRERFSAMGKLILPSVAVFIMIAAVDVFAYRGSDWTYYQEFNDARETLFDYEGVPPYEEVREILDRYQVSEAGYNAFASYLILDWVLPPECAGEIAAYAADKRETGDIEELWQELVRNMFEDSHWGINRILVVLWVAVAVMAILWKEASMLLPALGLLAGKMFSWGFLLYQGRFPLRVSMPLLAGEILLLLAILLKYGKDAEARLQISGMKSRYFRYCVLAFLLFLLCETGVLAGRQQYYYVANGNNGQRIFMEGLRDIGAYCNAHPENRYILDAVSMGYYRGSALEREIYGERNYIVAGSWYSNSPELRRYNKDYLSACEDFYFIVYDSGSGAALPCVSYLMEETGAEPEIYERLTVSHGGSYLILYFNGAYHIENL